MSPPLTILFEDNHCLAVNKPARLLTAGDKTGDVTLIEQARHYLKEKYGKPGNVYLGLVHRLDRPVSGVVLFAKTSKAAARLSEQFRSGRVDKKYQALVESVVEQPEGLLVDWLLKDEKKNVVRRVKSGVRGAREALLHYRRRRRAGGLTLLELRPRTGRSHQIRVQLAVRDMPIYGDTKYGAYHVFDGTIALHASELRFEHPTRHEPVTVKAPLPRSWKALLERR